MMTTRGITTDDRLLEQVAKDYRQRGYRVIVAPSSKQLPVFLRAYQPDLVAESSDESVVVEVKPRGGIPEQTDWAELARTVQQHPGWRLELIVGSDLESSDRLVIDPTEIEARLQEGRDLSKANMHEAALLITWSASEAAMRLVSHKQKVDLPDSRPATMISRLYTDGIIGREEYDELMRSMHMRSAVAHGLRQDGVDAESVERLHDLTLGLLRTA